MTFTVQGDDTPPSKVAHTSPSGATNEATPTFTWAADPVSTWYKLWVGYNSTDKIFAQWYDAADICFGDNCSVTPELDLPNGDYEWYIKSWNDYGKVWSDGMSFSVGNSIDESAGNLLSVGSWWKFQVSTNTSTTEANMTVIGESNIFGVEGVAIIEKSVGTESSIEYQKMIAGTVYNYNNGQTSAIDDVYYDFLSGPIGTSWSVTESTGIEQYEIVAIEDVQVPAGVFSGCYKVANNKINPSDGSVMSYDERWWHPETGYVKFREHIGLEDEQQIALIEYQIIP